MAEAVAGAVFLSYASQDAAAARRIAEALRPAGIEVWLDESELRSGDEWDRCIRQQIRVCTLFVPIISAHTQARREGYFRREWHLAAERTLDIARGEPFLVPVVIDDTQDRDALVPEEFLRLQWTRLTGTEVPSDFVARVQALLAATKRSPAAGAPGLPTARDPRRRWRTARILLGGAMLAALAVVVGWRFRNRHGADVDSPRAAAQPSRDPAAPSIAVLAFANLSAERDNEYFSDGISEELLNTLARVPGLRVAARKSAFSFKGANVPLTEITRRLGVNYVLDGTVRRDGSKVRISAELIKAADGFHAWSGRFDRELKDIFAVQDEITEAIVAQLRGTLLRPDSAHEALKASPARKAGTAQPDAYREYLLGRYFLNRAAPDDLEQAIAHLRAAIERDPKFAPAWAELGRVHSNTAQFGLRPVSFAEAFGQVRTAAEHALALDPNLAYGHMLLAHVQMVHDGNVAAANKSIARALELAPSDAPVVIVAALMRLFVGERQSALEFARRAAELDPVNPQVRVYLAVVHFYCDRLAEAEAEIRGALALEPKVLLGPTLLSYTCLLQGRLDEAVAAAERETTPHLRLGPLALVRQAQGRHADADAALAELATHYADRMAFNVAQIHAYRGEIDPAFAWLDRAFAHRDSALVHAKLDPFLRNLHGDRRWQQFLQRLGLAEATRGP